MAALKELLPSAKSSAATHYDHANDPWFKQWYTTGEAERSRKTNVNKPGQKTLPVTVDEHGNVTFDAIVKQNENASKIVYLHTHHVIIHGSLVTAQFLTEICSNKGNYTAGSNFKINLYRVLFNSLYVDSSNSIFSNRTEGQDPDTVYGLFLCQGNVSAADCQNCIYIASQTILSRCRFRKEGIIWLNQCMLRYSYTSFFSELETLPAMCWYNTQNITKPDNFNETMDDMFANLIPIATANRMYATNEADIGNSMKVRCTVQCTPDLSPVRCSNCLNKILNPGHVCSAGKYAGFVLTPSCNARYEFHQFVNETAGSSGKDGKMIAISVSISASVVFLLIGSVIYYQRRRKRTTEEEKERSSPEVQLLDLAQVRIVNDFNAENFEGERPVKSLDFPSVQFDLILEATKQFSEENKLGEEDIQEVAGAKIINRKPYACKAFVKVEPTKAQGSLASPKTSSSYTFDIIKAEEIFYHLTTDKLLRFSTGHKIPPLVEIKGKEYCKYHNSWNRTTVNCISFRNDIQDRIDKANFKFPDAPKKGDGS
ncbi:hypothetical protein Vadar_000205 [Vaccinium darrowii]|uniref:Uncharacterized protein n=1 Tax=Vaccinium darrowii TaxID=229202 RepID=A0ACB7X722_9ERIC|nr:hypothetical protein Vadar_000205 [Vaccinium darrowii]